MPGLVVHATRPAMTVTEPTSCNSALKGPAAPPTKVALAISIDATASSVAELPRTMQCEDSEDPVDELPDILDVPGFLEYLFPNSVLPLKNNFDSLVKALMLPESELWDEVQNKWVDYPLDSDSYTGWIHDLSPNNDSGDRPMPAFLNRIMKRIYDACHASRLGPSASAYRRWTENFDKTGTLTSVDPPQLCLVCQRVPRILSTQNRQKNLLFTRTPTKWKQVISTAALRVPRMALDDQAESDFELCLDRLKDETHEMFCSQMDRRFSIGLSFIGEDVRVYVIDRTGVVGSTAFNIHKEPVRFVRLMAGLALVDNATIGKDTTCRRPLGRGFVTVADEEYEIYRILFTSEDFYGPGTVCWRARRTRDGLDVVIKNIWEDTEASDLNEAQLMQLADVEGVAKLIASEIVTFNGRKDTTGHIRLIVKPDHPHYFRLKNANLLSYRRIVMTPYADELTQFKSKEEFLNVLIDAAEAIGRLEEKHIMHGDISLGNVRIYDPNPEPINVVAAGKGRGQKAQRGSQAPNIAPPHRRRGILIDLDNAMVFDEKWNLKSRRQENAGQGTAPFNSIEVIQNHPRRVWQDLESLFYVFICICWEHGGPQNPRRDPADDPDIPNPMISWFGDAPHTIDDAAAAKAAHMHFPVHPAVDQFESVVLPWFSRYFEDLKPCAREIRRLMFGRGAQKITPDEMADAFRQGLKDVEAAAERAKAAKGARSGKQRRASTRKGKGKKRQATTEIEDVSSGLGPRARSQVVNQAKKRQAEEAASSEEEGKGKRDAIRGTSIKQRRTLRVEHVRAGPAPPLPSLDQLMAMKSRLSGSSEAPEAPGNQSNVLQGTKRKAGHIEDAISISSQFTIAKKSRRKGSVDSVVTTGTEVGSNEHHEQRQRSRSLERGKKRMMEEEDFLSLPTPTKKKQKVTQGAPQAASSSSTNRKSESQRGGGNSRQGKKTQAETSEAELSPLTSSKTRTPGSYYGEEDAIAWDAVPYPQDHDSDGTVVSDGEYQDQDMLSDDDLPNSKKRKLSAVARAWMRMNAPAQPEYLDNQDSGDESSESEEVVLKAPSKRKFGTVKDSVPRRTRTKAPVQPECSDNEFLFGEDADNECSGSEEEPVVEPPLKKIKVAAKPAALLAKAHGAPRLTRAMTRNGEKAKAAR